MGGDHLHGSLNVSTSFVRLAPDTDSKRVEEKVGVIRICVNYQRVSEDRIDMVVQLRAAVCCI